MATKPRRSVATTVTETAAAAADAVMKPLEQYVAPGRRRTDNPFVVGTVILCLGITAVSSLVQITATLWAGSQLRILLDGQQARDDQVNKVREKLFKNTEAQGLVLRRMCLNTAKTREDEKECLAVGPTLGTPNLLEKPK